MSVVVSTVVSTCTTSISGTSISVVISKSLKSIVKVSTTVPAESVISTSTSAMSVNAVTSGISISVSTVVVTSESGISISRVIVLSTSYSYCSSTQRVLVSITWLSIILVTCSST